MQTGSLDNPSSYEDLLAHPAWRAVFSWLKSASPEIAKGTYDISGLSDAVAIVPDDTVTTRTNGTFESHKTNIDVHYCLGGGETIEWSPLSQLEVSKLYDAAQDVTLYNLPPQPANPIKLTAGHFAIFFPDDAHMPKIHDGLHPEVKKVVVKVKTSLVQ